MAYLSIPPRFTLLLAPLLLASPIATHAEEQSSGEPSGFEVNLTDDVPESVFSDSRRKDVFIAQVMLDRSRHSPGVIDGYMGGNTRRAISYFRKQAGLPEGDGVDADLLSALADAHGGEALTRYTITKEDLSYSFRKVPSSMSAMAKTERVGWETPLEMLADRFHVDMDFLAALNPDADFASAGTVILVPSRGEEQLNGKVERIEVRKSDGSVVAFGADGKVLASYPATIGSDQFPSPSGSMQVTAVAPDANYTFSPSSHDWGPDKSFVIPAGPNNPVGGIWIDLSKDGYGIHGSPDPQLIGKTSSHGCVRLTNWDAQELSKAVSQGVKVQFM